MEWFDACMWVAVMTIVRNYKNINVLVSWIIRHAGIVGEKDGARDYYNVDSCDFVNAFLF